MAKNESEKMGANGLHVKLAKETKEVAIARGLTNIESKKEAISIAREVLRKRGGASAASSGDFRAERIEFWGTWLDAMADMRIITGERAEKWKNPNPFDNAHPNKRSPESEVST